MGLKFRNPKFKHFMQNSIYIFYKMLTLEFRGQYDHSRTSKSDRVGLWFYTSIFWERKTVYTKLVPETVYYISYTSTFIWNHSHLFTICITYLDASTKVFSTTWKSHWTRFISKIINIRNNFIWICPLDLWNSCRLT